MELWLDTTENHIIHEAASLGILAGVTTNPSILSRANKAPEETITALLAIQAGRVAAQVIAEDTAGMVQQAQCLAALSPRIVVKIPVTLAGLTAIAILKQEKIPTLATTIFEPKQVLLAAKAGADYAAPYFSKIEETMGNSFAVIEEMQQLIKGYNFPLKLMAASITSLAQIMHCVKLGVAAITLPTPAYQALLAVPSRTEQSLANFKQDWQNMPHTATTSLFP